MQVTGKRFHHFCASSNMLGASLVEPEPRSSGHHDGRVTSMGSCLPPLLFTKKLMACGALLMKSRRIRASARWPFYRHGKWAVIAWACRTSDRILPAARPVGVTMSASTSTLSELLWHTEIMTSSAHITRTRPPAAGWTLASAACARRQ